MVNDLHVLRKRKLHLFLSILRSDENALEQAINFLGWRVYVTNHPSETFSLNDAVVAYRDSYLMERGFERLKTYPLSLTPMYLQREDYIKGLIRLLSIALRVFSLL